jgi:YidC/Oxa1 family membrane protein insertase
MTGVAGILVHGPELVASTIGQIFQPLLQAMAWLLAFFYALVPNYAIAIALLTILVMAVTSPLTIKSTRSMLEMQKVSPLMRELQKKYKGDRARLNEEMMKLYKEHNVNPAGGCLPTLVQFPIFIILYDVIRGLTNTVKYGAHLSSSTVCSVKPYCVSPRYIGHDTSLFQHLAHAGGHMPSFGLDLARSAVGSHLSAAASLPYWILIVVAVALQYLQMRQITQRNPSAAQGNPQMEQMQKMQKFLPLIFAFIYIRISAGVNVYFIVSSLSRIGIQEAMFRSGVVYRKPAAGGKAGVGRPSLMERLADMQARAMKQEQTRKDLEADLKQALPPPTSSGPSHTPGRGPTSGTRARDGASGDKVQGTSNAGGKYIRARGAHPEAGNRGRGSPPKSSQDGSSDGRAADATKRPGSRSRSKKPRRAR